jgi:hypothetical protein
MQTTPVNVLPLAIIVLLLACSLHAAVPVTQPVPIPPDAKADAAAMLVPVDLAKLGNAPLSGPDANLGGGLALAEGALPAEPVQVDAVPFHLATKGLNLATSLSGIKEPVRTKHGLLGSFVTAVPTDQYAALHLLAFSRKLDGAVPRLTVRLGFSYLFDEANTVIEVPDIRTGGPDRQVVSRVAMTLADGTRGYCYHLRVPIPHSANITLDMLETGKKTMNMELTRDVQVHTLLPDPAEFGFAPAGPPSSVVVLAATLERSPVAMTYTTGEWGNIFHDTQPPTLRVTVTNREQGPTAGRALARCAGPGTPEEDHPDRKAWTVSADYRLAPGETKELALDISPPGKKRGWYACTLELQAKNTPLQVRDTSFAVIAPDTRQAFDDSPFGTWVWMGRTHAVLAPANISERLGAIIRKGGWRWSMVEGAPEYKLRKTAVALPYCYMRGTGWYDEEKFQKEVVPAIKQAIADGNEPVFKVMHEARSSLGIVRRVSEFLDGDGYNMPVNELETFEQQYANVLKYCRAIKKAEPTAKVILINDYPAIGVEFMKRGFPADAFDIFGSEGAMFLREPERQPDWLSLLGQCATWERAKKEYGYQDKPVWFTEALYNGTNPGALTLHKQGVIYVREALLSLANGIERLGSMGTPRDYTDDYRQTSWGCTGFCGRDPEFAPKPSFAMFAWLTQLLDQAKYAGFLNTGSTSLHVLDFTRKDGSRIYPVWLARGRQQVTLTCQGGPLVVYDSYGNTMPVQVKDGKLDLLVSEAAVYVTGARVTGVAARKPIELKRAGGALLTDFADPAQLKAIAQPSKVLESNWDYPRLKGNFATEYVTIDGASILQMTLQPDADKRKLLQRYVELELAEPIELPGRPHTALLRVKGNGGWGRIMFELVDAGGRVWTSSGNQYPGACNASDTKGDSYVSFDGWQTMAITLPGQYPGHDQFIAWPHNANWWPLNTPERVRELEAFEQAKANYPRVIADFEETLKAHQQLLADYGQQLTAYNERKKAGEKNLGKAPAQPTAKAPARPAEPRFPPERGIARVEYPVRLTRLIVAMQPNLLYVNTEIPVADPAIAIDWLKIEQPPQGW